MAKIAISLPQELLQVIDGGCRASGETRSGFIRRAVQALVRRERERELDERYVQGYLAKPETPEDAEAVYRAGLSALSQEPWHDGNDL